MVPDTARSLLDSVRSRQKLGSSGHGRSVRYNPARLASWSSLVNLYGTVFAEPALWRIVGLCCAISMLVAAVVVFIPRIHAVDVDGLNYVNNVIRVLLAFILALYMSASVGRWWSSMTALAAFFEKVRQMHLALCAMNAPQERVATVRRYCLLSSALLRYELRTMWERDAATLDKAWAKTVQLCRERAWLSAEEEPRLLAGHQEHRAEMVWSWIGSVLAAQIADLTKAGAPPAAARVTALAAGCMHFLHKTKASVGFQIPLTYTHTVATLVHVNNLVLAFTSGMVLAISIQAAHRYDHAMEHGETPGGKEIENRREGFAVSVQTFLMRLFYLVISPLVYQAFLHIGSCMNDPFSDADHSAPLSEYIDDLEVALLELEYLAKQKPTIAAPKAQ